MRVMDVDGGNSSSIAPRGQSGRMHSSWWEEGDFYFGVFAASSQEFGTLIFVKQIHFRKL